MRIGCGRERHRDPEPFEDPCSCECTGVCEPQVGDVEPTELRDGGLEGAFQLEAVLPHRRGRQVAGRAERDSLDRDDRALGFAQRGVTPVGLGLGESARDRHHARDLGLRPERSAEVNEQRRDAAAVPHTRVRQLAVEPALQEDLGDPDPAPLRRRGRRTTVQQRGEQPVEGLARPDCRPGKRHCGLTGADGAQRQESAGGGEPELGPSVGTRLPERVEQHRRGPGRKPARGGGTHRLALVRRAKEAREQPANVGVVDDRRRLDESDARTVRGMTRERGRDGREDSSAGACPAARSRAARSRRDGRRRRWPSRPRRRHLVWQGGRPAPTAPALAAGGRRCAQGRAGSSRRCFPRTGPAAGSTDPARDGRLEARATSEL